MKVYFGGLYEVRSKIFRTDAAIYTSRGLCTKNFPNRPNCEFRVLLQSFAANA